MADKKISALPAASTPLAGTEVLPIVQSGVTDQVSVANLTAGRDVSMKNLTYTGTVTGSTDVIAIGTNQIYKDASGNVGIGLTNPGSYGALVVGGGKQIAPVSPDGTLLGIFSASNTQVKVGGYKTGGALELVFSSAADIDAAKFDNAGNLVMLRSAKGVNFTANTPAAGMTSQLLNWYEEGTWTPAFDTYAGSFTTLTYTSQQGTYTRVGRTVICNFSIVVNAVTTGTAATLLLLKGFPFALTNDGLAAGRAGGYINFYTGWTTNAPTMVNWAGFTDKLGLLYSGATNISNTPPANVTAGCELHGCVIYQI